MKETMKTAVIGLGQRGYSLLESAILPAAADYRIEISAVLDHYTDRTTQGAELVEKITGKRPIEAQNYEEILNMADLDAVIVTTAWESHISLAIAAMKAGKYTAMEVGGAYTLEDCWNLVHASEESGMPCMLLENCCYDNRELMALNMARAGVFGSVVHCSGGYCHDLRDEITNGKEIRHYRLRNYINRNCENYPTHELGPIAKLLDINNGNRMVSLTSTSSCAKGLHEYILKEKGADSPLADIEFAQGDIITTVIKCAKGQTIVLTLDTTLPRHYSRGFTVRGTKGSYFGETDSVFMDGMEHFSAPKGNASEYEEQYKHSLWQGYEHKDCHGGMDYLVFSAFFEALRANTRPPIDVYDAAAWMSITALSEESLLKGSAPVSIPDFTRGKWHMRTDINTSLKYNLDKKEEYADLYQYQ